MSADRVEHAVALGPDGWPAWPVFDETEAEALDRTLRSRLWWRNEGSETAAFEQEFASYQGGGHALALTNGTQAIEIALGALDIGEGDEVILPALTFYSTASAVLNVGAKPVFVDCYRDTYCLDPASAEAAINSRTAAIVAVHMSGEMCDMTRLRALCDRHALYLVEDAAHAPGAAWQGCRAGEQSDAATFSFQAAKLLTSGEGGLALFRDRDLHKRALQLSNCGRMPGDVTYDHRVLGTNARLGEFQSAVLRAQLSRLDQQIEQRAAGYAILESALGSVPGVVMQRRDLGTTRHARYAVMFEIAEIHAVRRGDVVARLKQRGVPAGICYPPVYQLPLFKERLFAPRLRSTAAEFDGFDEMPCPAAETIGAAAITLPHRLLFADPDRLVNIATALAEILSEGVCA